MLRSNETVTAPSGLYPMGACSARCKLRTTSTEHTSKSTDNPTWLATT